MNIKDKIIQAFKETYKESLPKYKELEKRYEESFYQNHDHEFLDFEYIIRADEPAHVAAMQEAISKFDQKLTGIKLVRCMNDEEEYDTRQPTTSMIFSTPFGYAFWSVSPYEELENVGDNLLVCELKDHPYIKHLVSGDFTLNTEPVLDMLLHWQVYEAPFSNLL